MTCKKNQLYQAYRKILQMEEGLHKEESCECQAKDMTIKQVYYLRIIDQNNRVTFSQLAQETRNSKPTITELINRFISMGCVYRERSSEDRRVFYIHLTPKGQSIARAQEKTHFKLVDRISNHLTNEELDQLITLLNKIL